MPVAFGGDVCAGVLEFDPEGLIDGEVGERIEIGEREAIEELARAIVSEMRSDF